MTLSEWLAIALNLAIAAYLIHFYPKTQAKAFRDVAIPRGFLILRGVAKAIGYAVVVASLGYVAYRFAMAW